MLVQINYRNVSEAAKEIGLTKARIYQLVAENKLTKLPIHRRAIVILVDDKYKKELADRRKDHAANISNTNVS